MEQSSSQETWRAYVRKLYLDRRIRERLRHELGAHPQTVRRWINNQTTPRTSTLIALLDALPEYREELLVRLRADPKIGLDFLQDDPAHVPLKIPVEVYAELLRLLAETPRRFRDLVSLILHCLRTQLDPTRRVGIHLIVAKCMPPRVFPAGSEVKVRSLLQVLGMGTRLPLHDYLEEIHYFLGAESLAGYALSTGHSEVVHNTEDSVQFFPVHYVQGERSVAAAPIKRQRLVAGVLLVSCYQPNFFTQTRIDLLDAYANAIALAFADTDFVPLDLIDLGEMPPWVLQSSHFEEFWVRVEEAQRAAMGDGHIVHDVLLLEEQVRRTYELEFLRMQAGERYTEQVASGQSNSR
jgi:hypothetical protein